MILAAFLAAAPAGPPAVPPTTGVAELVQRHGALTGRVVRVRGRLAECRPRSCGLLDDERQAAPVDWLSFAAAPRFDASARSLIGRRVVVEGVVLGQCWPTGRRLDIAVCADRAPQFRPGRIVRLLPDRTPG